eukprot:GHVQ01042362.1.p1 GENE.GHVQ01042362.1~~GHVQ01042362.1.p1  ORF type:complete len:196 (-),score=41.43 GHVQ01042362.1:105-692(-)
MSGTIMATSSSAQQQLSSLPNPSGGPSTAGISLASPVAPTLLTPSLCSVPPCASSSPIPSSSSSTWPNQTSIAFPTFPTSIPFQTFSTSSANRCSSAIPPPCVTSAMSSSAVDNVSRSVLSSGKEFTIRNLAPSDPSLSSAALQSIIPVGTQSSGAGESGEKETPAGEGGKTEGEDDVENGTVGRARDGETPVCH